MPFTVQRQHGHFNVLSYGMILASFASKQEAEQEALRLNEEYERILSVL